MGNVRDIQNDSILCYGIEFSYKEIKHLKNKKRTKRTMKDIDLLTFKVHSDSDSDDNWMPNLWEDLGFISASNHYDSNEKSFSYIVGKEIKTDITINEFLKEINEKEMIVYLKNICEKYNLKYKEPKVLCRPNIY